MNIVLTPGQLTFAQIRDIINADNCTLTLDPSAYSAIDAAEQVVQRIVASDKTVYGINTGFGILANQKISRADLTTLQTSLVLSHATGTGELLADQTVKLILLLKINSLARGYSGVRRATIDFLIRLFNEKMYPCIPGQGSVGASGDLAPLAHLSATLLGVGDVRYQGEIVSAQQGLAKLNISPLILGPKEGLSLLNGTQASTALALQHLFSTENLFFNALVTGALSVDATRGSSRPFDPRIQAVRGHTEQAIVAEILQALLTDSEISQSHTQCPKVQDPYSLRCQPQVMGACLANINYAKKIILTEANAVSDNPLVFAEDDEIISGGNFHAEPVGMAADCLALAIAEMGALAERRIALLTDPKFSGLPAFLVNNAGLNSGFMIAQVTAAALASENKSLAHPATVDSMPTSANQEDHVSMATYAARRLGQMVENTNGIVAIELLAACQGIDLLRPLRTSAQLEQVLHLLRLDVAFYNKDRFFAPDIKLAKEIIAEHKLLKGFEKFGI